MGNRQRAAQEQAATSVCLALIVRDAEDVVARCIESCLRLYSADQERLVDRAVIIDTGCTDNTIAVIKETLGEIPVTFHESEWVGHYHNRTELLALARDSGADYTLMPDADMELVQEKPLRTLDADEYSIPIRDRGLHYPLPLLTSNAKQYVYKGVAHAYLACEDGRTRGEILDEIYFWDHGGGGHREGKIERDRDLLAAEVAKNPLDLRSIFYLAQSFRDLDQVDEAIAMYKFRAMLGGWPEEVYQALYQAGMLLSAHVNFYDGAKLLIAAAEMKQNRAEALRALAICCNAVADKIPFPADEVLFVEPGAYTAQQPAVEQQPVRILPLEEMPPLPSIKPTVKRLRRKRVTRKDVTPIIVTRGNVDLQPCLNALDGFDDIVVWNNAERETDYKIFGRFAAIPEAKNPVIAFMDDDVIFTAWDELLSHYEPNVATANMDLDWRIGAGYEGEIALFGAGSVLDSHLPGQVFDRYLSEYPFDDEVLVEADFIFGTLVNWKVVDLPYVTRPFSDDPGRLYTTPGQTQRKWTMIGRCKELKQRLEAA